METTTHRNSGITISTDRLLEARLNRALTQDEVAAKIGATRRSYQRWETGETSPQPRYLRELSDLLKVSVPWLRGVTEMS